MKVDAITCQPRSRVRSCSPQRVSDECLGAVVDLEETYRVPRLEDDKEPSSDVGRDGHALRIDAAEPEFNDERRQEVCDRRRADVD